MASAPVRRLPAALALLLVAALACASGDGDPDAEEVAGLLRLQRSSSDGVIHFSPTLFAKYATSARRPYSLVFMLTARHLMDKPSLKLKQLRAEFGLAASAYRGQHGAGDAAGRVFFAEMEFRESKEIFERLGADSLPFIFHVAPGFAVGRSGPIGVPEGDRMSMKDHPKYPWPAEAIAEFVAAKTGLGVDEIERRSILQSPFFGILALVTLFAGAGVAYRLYYMSWVRHPLIYLSGTLAVCWFATSGGMFNIIRNVPFALPKPDGKVEYFYPGHSQQLGAEGFVMGTLYLLFAGATVAMTYGVPMLESKNGRRAAFYTAVMVAFLTLRQVVQNYQWKTGYHIRQYVF
ncbi:unnamed protein product [Ostreobium quekettii]|uniref:Uncharacterized protein n=1 Tax=Ostreobium quekettii TaxID=121088 RepID=A0A8S1JAB1_9CHLO|nr:unnamed protein product [Ostreobium quekettii]|eukprot:evm.model.scf_1350.4 EVM.evm.TU.scf_1350.4   scf_1350:27015-28177(-)